MSGPIIKHFPMSLNEGQVVLLKMLCSDYVQKHELSIFADEVARMVMFFDKQLAQKAKPI